MVAPLPVSGSYSRHKRVKTVLLPDPLGPTSAVILPGSIRRLTLSRLFKAGRQGYAKVTSLSSNIGGSVPSRASRSLERPGGTVLKPEESRTLIKGCRSICVRSTETVLTASARSAKCGNTLARANSLLREAVRGKICQLLDAIVNKTSDSHSRADHVPEALPIQEYEYQTSSYSPPYSPSWHNPNQSP